jgi:hypothetical protein
MVSKRFPFRGFGCHLPVSLPPETYGTNEASTCCRSPDPLRLLLPPLTGTSESPNSPKVHRKNAGPIATVRHGSAAIPVYRITSGTRTRFAISLYRDGKRMRQVFRSIEAAKKEALVVARQIQAGMQYLTDPRAC